MTYTATTSKPLTIAMTALLAVILLLVACSSSAAMPPGPTATTAPQATATAAPPSPTPTAAPAPSPTSPPTVNPVPTATPATAVKTVTEASRLAAQAMDFLRTFTTEASPRASATAQEKAAAEYLLRKFEALGYEARLQPFTVQIENTQVSIAPSGQGNRNIESIAMSLSGRGSASGALVNVGKAFQEDIPPAGLDGKIALIQRGDITFEEKVTRVAQAGAVAALVYNNVPGLFRGALSQQAAIPAVTIPQDSGEAILALMSSTEVSATISVDIQERSSHNVIAEKPGTAGDGRAVILGGHYDTVPAVPGANDNGSGTSVFMTIAREVANKSYPFTLRFMGFGSEELGLEGSSFYVNSLSAQERKNVIAMLNFDALGSGPVLGVMGDANLVARVIELGQRDGVEVQRRFGMGGGSSDHASFQGAGVPVAFFLADDFSRIHTPDDKLEFVRPELLGNAAAMGIALLDSLAER